MWISSKKYFHRESRIVFDQISGYYGPANLMYKIHHHRGQWQQQGDQLRVCCINTGRVSDGWHQDVTTEIGRRGHSLDIFACGSHSPGVQRQPELVPEVRVLRVCNNYQNHNHLLFVAPQITLSPPWFKQWSLLLIQDHTRHLQQEDTGRKPPRERL